MTDNEIISEYINTLKEKIELLEGIVTTEQTRRINAVDAYNEILKKMQYSKAEAIESYIQKLKAEALSVTHIGGSRYYVFNERTFAEVAEEMIGENNG